MTLVEGEVDHLLFTTAQHVFYFNLTMLAGRAMKNNIFNFRIQFLIMTYKIFYNMLSSLQKPLFFD